MRMTLLKQQQYGYKGLAWALACVLLAACSTQPKIKQSAGHIDAAHPPAAAPDIPAPITQAPVLPPPKPETRSETFTVIVNEVPVKELLFALARDAKMNLDIYDNIQGTITINAVDQTLPQILE